MAKASEQFRQSDVTVWGIVALVCVALAVFGSNISLLVPQSILGGLHQPRVAGASIETLRLQVADLREETTRLKRENELLVTRFTMQERSSNEVTRRVGALEVSVPRLLETMPDGALVDRSTFTSSIGANETLTFDADGGSVAVRQSNLPQAATSEPADQPLPEIVAPQVAMVAPNESAYGIAVGAAVPFEETGALWSDLTLKLGPLLFGLAPLVVDEANGDDKRIVVGPIADLSEARALCQRFERVSIACIPMPYSGTPLTTGQ
ncbi:SPOR domain-containing protein [Devosia sediminis]|uniref:SPOR domain-containing protein n=1 Tax=Devosia sediminis TaxID=2798801 RepID=A0A934IS73_9HYPH|nr:SPOR domain-containing protein [Devosia sediminis]MBJ3784221.1 SPOR domain-containing protein [Devosia sediminis]